MKKVTKLLKQVQLVNMLIFSILAIQLICILAAIEFQAWIQDGAAAGEEEVG